jgi:hypothetical protein
MINRLALVLALFCVGNVRADEVGDLWRKAFGDARLVLPSAEELRAAESAFTDELQGQGERADWQALKMRRIADRNRVVIAEIDSARQGRGIFMLNGGAGTENWLLQAPHAKFDMYTGDLAALLFAEAPFRAAQWNSVSRNAVVVKSSEKADMAHLDNTYWQAFTRAFAGQFPQGRIVQIHGYAQSNRETDGAEASDIIVSAGRAYPPQWVQSTAACLKSQMPGTVSLYPFEVDELGGTTNAQGKLLQSLNHEGFLHLEMSYSMRKLLLDRQDLRRSLATCLKG